MFILLCMVSFALAEPPVGNSYLEAAQLSQDHTSHHEYLPPDLTVPSARTSKSFNALSNQYLPPSTRGISQEYGLPSGGTSTFRSGISQEYGTPFARSSQYDSYNADLNQSFSSARKSSVSQRYGAPSSRNSPSSLNASPFQRSPPSSNYGTPQFRSSHEFAAHTSPVQKYGVPSVRSNSQSHSKSNLYHLPELLEHSNGLSSRLQNPQFQSSANPSQSYGTPARSLSSQYGTPSARNTVTGFQGSSGSSNSNTNAYASSYPSLRSPSLGYGAPSSRASEPSQVYGLPQDSLVDQGYEYARNALDLLNQESANYEFAYKVSDEDTGSDFGHTETRQLDRAEGAYFVLLPDGTKQVVEYEADEDGFRPRISVEQVDSPTAFAAEGPY